jgi:hypothetical protein
MNITVTTSWQEITIADKLLQNIGTVTIDVARADAAEVGLRMKNKDILSGELWGQDNAFIRVSTTSSATSGQVRLV